MNNRTFSPEEFQDLVFGPEKPFNKDFLKKWNNIECVNSHRSDLWTPVEWAASSDYVDVVKFLVENGADITLDNNFTFRTAIHYYCIDVIKYLLSTNIYTEEYIRACTRYTDAPELNELLTNYKQFPNTKVCK